MNLGPGTCLKRVLLLFCLFVCYCHTNRANADVQNRALQELKCSRFSCECCAASILQIVRETTLLCCLDCPFYGSVRCSQNSMRPLKNIKTLKHFTNFFAKQVHMRAKSDIYIEHMIHTNVQMTPI